jgi:hypothetical protein
MNSPKYISLSGLRTELLLNYIFMLALVLLIVNDHFWKANYANVLTGKLSDFAGLILLPLCLAYLFPRLRERAVLWSALFFLFWKTPLASPFIEWYNLIAPIPISRVVDYTDYIAFAILPLPWWMIRQPELFKPLALPLRASPWSWGLLLVTSVSFVATSPPYWLHLSAEAPGNVRFYESPYKVEKSPTEILARLTEEGIVFEQYERQDSTGIYYYRYLSDSNSAVRYQFYVIPQLILDDDTLNDIHFMLSPTTSGYTGFLLQSMNVPDSSSTYITERRNKVYLRLLKKELVRKVRR